MARDITAKLLAVQEELRARDEESDLFKSQSKFRLLNNPRLFRAGAEGYQLFANNRNHVRTMQEKDEETSCPSSSGSSRSQEVSVEPPDVV